MKKNYKSSLSFLGKAGKRFIMATALTIMSAGVYGQTLVDEDFSGQILPAGWDTSNVIGNWSFDNPGGRSISGGNPGFDSDFAIFDSDDICVSSEEGTLESSSFDASNTTVAYTLEFDNSFRSYTGATQEGHVDVWNGTTWTEVFVLPAGTSDGYSVANHKTVDITAACGGATAAKVRFRSTNGACNWWWAIDNVTINAISCPVPTALAITNITSGSADIGWTAPVPAPANGYEYYYSISSAAPSNTTTASGSVGAAITTTGLSGLAANSTYYVWVRAVCSSTDTSDWSASATFVTFPDAQIPAILPYTENFTSTASDWTILNGTETNQWYIGAATGNTGNSLYVTDNGGANNAYDIGNTSVVQAYRDIAFTPGSNPFNLMFDWKLKGEGTSTYWDYFRVWIVPQDYVPSPGTQISSGMDRLQIGGSFNDPTASTATWHTENFIIPASYAGDTVRLVFEWNNDGGGGSQPPAAIDNIYVSEITCSAPTTVAADNIAITTADISWTAISPAPTIGYEYYYSTSSAPPAESAIALGSVGAGDTTDNLTGLIGNTTYYVWVRSICSTTDTSSWSSFASFTTLCGMVIAPATYDVESAVATTNSTIGDCWSSDPNGNSTAFRWNVDDNGTTPSSNTGPSGAYSGSHYFYTEASSGSSGDSAVLSTPVYDISSLSTPAIEFYYHMYGSDIGTLYIQTSDGTGWTDVDSLVGEQQASGAEPWLKRTVVLSGFSGVVLQVRFKAVRIGSGAIEYEGDISLDDISVIEAPTCFAPGPLTIVAVQDQSAQISWNAASPAPANGYQYYYNTTNVAPTNGTVALGSVGAADTSADLTGLTELTTYYVWVRSVCSATDTSSWSLSATFTTLPTPQVPATLPYSDDFANTATDWTLVNGTQTNTWFIGNATGNTGNSLYVSNDDGTTNAYTTSPASVASVVQAYRDIALTPGINPFKLLFDWKCMGEGTSTIYDYFRVWVVPHTYVPSPGSQISVAGSGGIQLGGDINDAGSSTASWHGESYIIPDSFAGDTVRLVFEWRNDGSSGSQPPAAIDNIDVMEITCSAPTTLVASNVTSTSADISWTAPIVAPANGYQYYYSVNSAVPTASTNPSGSVNAPLTTTGLAPLAANTQYYVWVRSVCSATDSSEWTGGTTFTTLCDAGAIPYIAPLAAVITPDVPSCMSTELINTLGTEWYTINNPGSGFSGNTLISAYTGSGDGDVDSWVYTNGLLLTGGLTYQLHYRYGNNSTSYSERLEVKYGNSATVSGMSISLTDHDDVNDAIAHDTAVTFTPVSTGTYYIGFHAYSDEDQYNLYLDSITVMLLPCDSAIALTVANLTSTSAELGWTGTAAQYTLEYGASGFSLGTGTSVSVMGNSYILNNLDPNNTYDYYVRSICTPGIDSSAYSVLATFTTLCDPVLVSLGNDTAFCNGGIVVLDAGVPSATVEWNDASTTQTLSVTVSGDYYVIATDTNGCVGSDTITVTVHSLPVVDLGVDTGICVGDILTLNAANTGSSYLWNDGSTQQILDADIAGNYAVVVTDANGCVATDTLALLVNDLPLVDLDADTSICEGDTLLLDAGNPGSDYIWSDASTGQTLTPLSTGDYWVVVTNAGGCSASDTIHVEVTSAPSIDGIIATDNGAGSYSFSVENPSGISEYEWDFGDGSPQSYDSEPTHVYPNTGTDSITITVVVRNECGSDSASITIPGPGVGIHQVEPGKDKLKLYPNPARDLVIIQNESQFKMEEMTVYNILGQVVFHTRLKAVSKHPLDVSGYASGLYQVRIKMDGGFAVRKFEVIR